VYDSGNGRVLIWNTFPTENQQAANVVVGQVDMTSMTGTCDASHLAQTTNGNAFGLFVHNGKLLISDVTNRRILIWNTIPENSGVAADVVLGQTNTTTCSAPTISASSLNSPRGINVDPQGRLFVADGTSSNRVLIWNTIPTTNNAPANVVIGQPDFISNSTPATAAGLSIPLSAFSNGERLFIADNNNNRVLIFNSIPTTNGASADMVLGQTNFTSNANVGITQYSMQNPQIVFEYQNKLFISEAGGDRILIFDNLIKKPGISLNNAPEDRDGGLIRLTGTVRVDSPYIVQSLQYAVNGGGYANATATDGSFSSTSEDFYFDFDPKSNNYNEDGYTVRIKSSNNNTDVTDQLFYFSPFTSNSPSNNSFTTNQLPTFEFTVNKGRFQDLKDNLSKFQVQINKDNSGWQTYIDTIPVSYEAVKGDGENIYRTGDNTTNGNGTYEDKKMWVNYSNNNATIKVYSKSVDSSGNVTDAYFENGGHKLSSGSYQWKIVAVDKAGHTQETDAKYLRVNTTQAISSQGFFPLAVLNISGLGNPDISTTNPGGMKQSYTLYSSNPIFYGIANVGSKVSLEITDPDCDTDCIKLFDTTANSESRFGINVPLQTLKSGKTYSTRMFVSMDDNYNELPTFDLKIK
jgi:hypothetical protein